MKRIFLFIVTLFIAITGFSQTDQGYFLIETNTTINPLTSLTGIGNGTAISLTSIDGEFAFNVGLESGYFVKDNFALKLGLGYGQGFEDQFAEEALSIFSYLVGFKYYVSGSVPLQVDYNGQMSDDLSEDLGYVGLQIGYAIFLGREGNFALEPNIRYNVATKDFLQDVFQLQVGFSLFL